MTWSQASPLRRSLSGGWSRTGESTLSSSSNAQGDGGFASPARAAAPRSARSCNSRRTRLAARRSSRFSSSSNVMSKSRSSERRAPAGVEVGKGVSVLDGEGRLAEAADAVHRREHPEATAAGGPVQELHLGLAADEARVVRRDVPWGAGDAAQAREARVQGAFEVFQSSADFGALERGRALVEPRSKIAVVAATNLGQPRRGALPEAWRIETGNLDEVDRCDSLPLHGARVLV